MFHEVGMMTESTMIRCAECKMPMPDTDPCPVCKRKVCDKCSDPMEGVCLKCPVPTPALAEQTKDVLQAVDRRLSDLERRNGHEKVSVMPDELKDLATALCKAQAAIEGASKDSTNPHYNSKYADLASIWDACRKPLTDHGLSIVQMPSYDSETQVVTVETVLLHSSGQRITSALGAPVPKTNAQGVGSVITYLRRYALAAVVGVAPEDDDAESGVDHSKQETRRPNFKNAKGEIILPGTEKNWSGQGGKPLTEISTKVLSGAYDWFKKKDGEAALLTAMEEELKRRPQSESFEKVPAAIKEHEAEMDKSLAEVSA